MDTPYYERAGVRLFLGDCRSILPTLDKASIDLVLTDPPYGIRLQTNFASRGLSRMCETRDYPPVFGDDKAFDPSHLLQFKRVIMFGANHYADKLPASATWLVWDKLAGLVGKRDFGFCDQADVELAWSNIGGPARLFQHRWMGLLKDSERQNKRQHPTQKPVQLMAWCVLWAKAEGTICDPYLGSGSTGEACIRLGRSFVGIEIEERWCEHAAKRLDRILSEPRLPFVEEKPDVQAEMFHE